MCECLSCQVDGIELPNVCEENKHLEPSPCNVSDAQRVKIRKEMKKKYRLNLRQTGHYIGGIDTRTGVTLELSESVVSKCDHFIGQLKICL